MRYKKGSFLNPAFVRTFLAFVLFAAISSSHSADENAEPVQVVGELLSAMEANDAEQIRSLFSSDATQEYERFFSRQKQGDAFRDWLESDIIEVHGRVSNPEITADGNEVVVTGTYTNNDDYSSPADFLFVVEGGKITSWTMRYD
ncbi:MAG: nuclear transport factor 2 family protein [Algiphilus sp.]